jgi:hypothetical protein
MNHAEAGTSIEEIIGRLKTRHRFSAEELHSIEQRWQLEAGDTADSRRFLRWLVARGYLTEQETEELDPPAPPVAPAAPTSDVLSAVLVAPAAAACPERVAVPVAAAAAHGSAPTLQPPEPTVELIALPAPTLPAQPAPPARVESDITVELIPMRDSPVVVAKSAEEKTSGPSPTWLNNVWLYLFLGAVGLLVAQLAGWLLAHLITTIF